MGPNETVGGQMDSIFPYLSFLSLGALRSCYLKQEPYELIPHVWICAGGAGRLPFLPRSLPRNNALYGRYDCVLPFARVNHCEGFAQVTV